MGFRRRIFYPPKLSGALICASFTIANVIARRGSPAATFLIKRKWPKTVAALGFHSSNTPVAPEVRASLSLPRESDKERPGSPPDPRAGRQPSSGGCRPGLPLDSRPNPGLHWPPGRIGAPCAAGPGRGASAQPARCSRRNLGFRYPLGRVWEMGPKRQPGTGGVAPAGTKILLAFGFQDFIAFFCPGSILRERGTT